MNRVFAAWVCGALQNTTTSLPVMALLVLVTLAAITNKPNIGTIFAQ